ncbi:AraC family transcriptional regulator [Chitinibacter sp. SCUT-21]|uniref:helix-turn-helix domain-containing protein n=1 Tax=Chitinibacter sp. SCUT-21 TaxID=2970891 RepID=UPI0035A680A4
MLEMSNLISSSDTQTLKLRSEHDGVVLTGRVFNEKYHNQLELHCSDIKLKQQIRSQSQLKPGIKLIVMLEGCIAMQSSRMQHRLDSQQSGVLLVSSTENEPFKRAMLELGSQQQVVLHVPPEWFEEGGYTSLPSFKKTAQFCQQHLAYYQWRASKYLQSMCKMLFQDWTLQDHMQKLHREFLALELLHYGLEPLSGKTFIDPRAEQRVARLIELLHSGEADHYSLSEMASAVGSNATTLQKQFQEKMGLSIFDYLRRYKLENARLQLQQGLSVTEAALIAGYKSPANFTTAFKRLFGALPKNVRVHK